jgi:phenylalanyl-tRNA synthetase alpha chain
MVLRALAIRHAQFSGLSRKCMSTAANHVQVFGKSYPKDTTTNITESIIGKLERRLHQQPSHPLGILRTLIESHWPTYTHLSNFSPVVTPARNFDDLAFPADHPGRLVTDSYYINKEYMLRTHTSAHEVETFAKNERKWLLTADVYRRDEIDSSHYPVFHQMEGASIFDANAQGTRELLEENEKLADFLRNSNIVIEDIPHITPTNPVQDGHDPAQTALVAENLKLSLNSLMLTLFGSNNRDEPLRVRWIEAYFPFTSPSYEVEVFFNGKWLEILGCGVVLRSILERASTSFSSRAE